MWAETIESRRACMSEEDLRKFDFLHEQVEVWRGTSNKRGIKGLSWTLDEKIAVWFAQRFCSESRVPLLARGMVEKRDVLAYFGERNEQEIISGKVVVMSVTKLSDIPSVAPGPIVTTWPTTKPVAPMPTLNLI